MKTHFLRTSLLILCIATGCARPAVSQVSAASQASGTQTETPRFAVVETLPRQRSITVTGNAEVRVVPDEASLSFGVETWDKDLDVAKSKNDDIVGKVLSALERQGVEPKHIQTDYLNIEPRYEDSYERRNFIGYFVRKNIEVTLKDLAKFEAVLTNLLQAGVNYVNGVVFRTTELRKHRDEARALALQAALEKAAAMAKELGQEIGEPLSIREERSEDSGWYRWWWGGSPASQNVVQNAGGVASGTGDTMSLGQIPVNAAVTVEFELK